MATKKKLEVSEINNRQQAVDEALADKVNVPNTCQLKTRGWFNAPSAGDQDDDGDADAYDGWLSEPVSARHPGDRNPPAGVPVSWRGGSNGNGHRAISLGNGEVRSTDAPYRGKVGTVDLNWFERNWGVVYLGWSDTIDGHRIPLVPRDNPIEDNLKEPKPDTKLGRSLALLREARNRAKDRGYTERVEELNAAIKKLILGYNKK
jgi:hypothetical protein